MRRCRPGTAPLFANFLLTVFLCLVASASSQTPTPDQSLVYLWPLPKRFTSGNATITVDPNLSLLVRGNGGASYIVREAFERCRLILFNSGPRSPLSDSTAYDIKTITIVVDSADETLQLGVDESYSLYLAKDDGQSIVGEAMIEANTIYGAVRGLETFSQLCTFNYETKTVEVNKAPWYIQDEPRFKFRGLHIDTSRHYQPITVIKQVIESMSYAKLVSESDLIKLQKIAIQNVLHWHIVDEQSFPLEVPSYPDLWKGSYTKWERFTVEDAYELVEFAKKRGINIMPEIDVPGHAESWGIGYPDLWPSPTCREPLDVSKNFTFDLISGILRDLRKIFPFEFFHLGGDEVNTDCWNSTQHVNQWLQERNMTRKDAYQYFVLKVQEIALAQNRTPVNWEETFNSFSEHLNPQTVVHNWLGPGVCPKVVAKGFRCIVSNEEVFYLDHLGVPWEDIYISEPLEGINDTSQQKLVLGGQVCMWSETADASVIQQTIWPRAAAAAVFKEDRTSNEKYKFECKKERFWSRMEDTSNGNLNTTVLPRLEYFRCLLNRRGIPAAPVTNKCARQPPVGPGSCYVQ